MVYYRDGDFARILRHSFGFRSKVSHLAWIWQLRTQPREGINRRLRSGIIRQRDSSSRVCIIIIINITIYAFTFSICGVGRVACPAWRQPSPFIQAWDWHCVACLPTFRNSMQESKSVSKTQSMKTLTLWNVKYYREGISWNTAPVPQVKGQGEEKINVFKELTLRERTYELRGKKK